MKETFGYEKSQVIGHDTDRESVLDQQVHLDRNAIFSRETAHHQDGNNHLDVEMADIMSHSVKGKNVYLHGETRNSMDRRSASLRKKSQSHADLGTSFTGKL